MSEDCLYLNIWTPAEVGEGLPVFLWIHGGGSRSGSGADPTFDGTELARKGIVVVTINYRLGPIGFLSTEELSAESSYGGSGNYGFMDDLAALAWVRRNIAQFGGDPARITIGGESAGSIAVGVLAIAPPAKGLFHQLIGESGSVFSLAQPGSMAANGLAAEEAKGAALMAAVGARDLAAFRQVPAETLAEVGEGLFARKQFFNLPVIDGAVIPREPLMLLKDGANPVEAYLLGWNSNEASVASDRNSPLTPREMLARYYGAKTDRILPFYADLETAEAKRVIAGDHGIAHAMWKWAFLQTKAGTAPVYVYQFDQAPTLPEGYFGPDLDVSAAGAFHGAEMPYVFDTLDSQKGWTVTSADRAVASQMSNYWAAFIKTGNPDVEGQAHWPVYIGSGGPQRMQLEKRANVASDPDFARYMAILEVQEEMGNRPAVAR